jgi:hypothetical protein
MNAKFLVSVHNQASKLYEMAIYFFLQKLIYYVVSSRRSNTTKKVLRFPQMGKEWMVIFLYTPF